MSSSPTPPQSKVPNLHAAAFLQDHGREEAARVCAAAGTTLVYFEQVAKGDRNFSRKLAEKLEEASGGRLDRVALVFGSNPPPAVDETGRASHS